MTEVKNFLTQFNTLNDIELNEVSNEFVLKQYDKGAWIVEEGKRSDYLFLLISGSVRSFHIQNGKEITTWFGFKDELITSYSGFITRNPSRETIESLEPITLYALHFDKLQQLYKKYHNVETLGRKITEMNFLWLDDRMYNFQYQSARERYETLMQREPELLQKVSLGQLASFLGITQETLSRLRRG